MVKLDVLKKKFKELASRLSEKNKYERVIKDYLNLAESRPNDMRIRLKIAETCFKARNIPMAIETYEEVANHYISKNFVLKAVTVLKNILKLDPARIDINLKLAELYLKLEMKADAVNQYRIAAQFYQNTGNRDELILTCRKIVDLDPSIANRRKLGEVYQSYGMVKEFLEQFETVAQILKQEKNFDDLLKIYELILAHKPNNTMIRDVCILYLRKQEPDHAIKTMERHKVDSLEEFAELYDKAKLMKKALRSNKQAAQGGGKPVSQAG